MSIQKNLLTLLAIAGLQGCAATPKRTGASLPEILFEEGGYVGYSVTEENEETLTRGYDYQRIENVCTLLVGTFSKLSGEGYGTMSLS